MIHLYVFAGMLIGSCFYAIARGGAPERIIGVSLIAAAIASWLALSSLEVRFVGVEWGELIVDLILLGVLVAVALRADRGWPLSLAGLQLSTVDAHLLKLVEPGMIRVTYAMAVAVWSYPMVVLLAFGTWRHRSRLERQGLDIAWSPARA